MTSKIKSARILLTLHPDLLGEVDREVEKTLRSRSEFIRDAIRSYLKNPSR